ncbi:hypothetical protein P872_12505 [Rhodonellum psychrophilum GCM71 = DSM 17998]|uniref:2-amino-4-hydroxy-6-hydroxymethyldihydropteridine pyrophosphokinase n=2 Tax=Rhodonellum TaxID=336827 RepID=U5BVK0_9BACT|nr:hypothetical protein P872_12505 [Rhodonellum psychrophilum GCM71 = DSM 17998]
MKLIEQANSMLRENFSDPLLFSSVFETAAWGKLSEGDYLNQVLVFQTNLAAEGVLTIIQEIENRLGRKREEKWGNRTMDIDILYFGQQVIQNRTLIIPHPFISRRRFVLEPLVEILPDFIHPILRVSSTQMLEICTDTSSVVRLIKK